MIESILLVFGKNRVIAFVLSKALYFKPSLCLLITLNWKNLTVYFITMPIQSNYISLTSKKKFICKCKEERWEKSISPRRMYSCLFSQTTRICFVFLRLRESIQNIFSLKSILKNVLIFAQDTFLAWLNSNSIIGFRKSSFLWRMEAQKILLTKLSDK